MTTIDIIINLGQEVLQSVTTLFRLAARRFQAVLCLYIVQSVLPLLLFSSYPLPTLTMHHIPFLANHVAVFERLFTPLHNMRWRPRFCTG